jgi:threonine/homoserine/homoserine lactone efflux protein
MDPALEASLWASGATIALVWTVTVVSPGPNFLATVQAAMTHSRRAGVQVAFGIAVGTTIWATASLLGLGLLFQSAGWLYHAVRILGAAYLVFVGLRTLSSARRPVAAARPGGPEIAGARAVRRGLLTDLSNPKAAAFFTSLFAVTVPPAAPFWFDAGIVALVVGIAGGWYALCACLLSLGPVSALFRRAQRAVTALAGVLFVALGLRLAMDR